VAGVLSLSDALANSLVPIFAGLLLGHWAGRRGWMDSGNVRNLILLVMNVAIPCAMFSIITRGSRDELEDQWNSALVIALVFGALYALPSRMRQFTHLPLVSRTPLPSDCRCLQMSLAPKPL
jgi:predicted permease